MICLAQCMCRIRVIRSRVKVIMKNRHIRLRITNRQGSMIDIFARMSIWNWPTTRREVDLDIARVLNKELWPRTAIAKNMLNAQRKGGTPCYYVSTGSKYQILVTAIRTFRCYNVSNPNIQLCWCWHIILAYWHSDILAFWHCDEVLLRDETSFYYVVYLYR